MNLRDNDQFYVGQIIERAVKKEEGVEMQRLIVDAIYPNFLHCVDINNRVFCLTWGDLVGLGFKQDAKIEAKRKLKDEETFPVLERGEK